MGGDIVFGTAAGELHYDPDTFDLPDGVIVAPLEGADED